LHKKILVAMSGGVDSSVAAFLLKEQGYEIAGVSMCLGIKADGGNGKICCDRESIEDAKRVCADLSIPHYIFDYSTILEDKIIEPFVEEYKNGKTPNPCVVCNRIIKFGLFLQTALALGFDGIATGHYARIVRNDERYLLCRPFDKHKDQTYFLYSIPYESLRYIVFPVSEMSKTEVRLIAYEKGLPVAEKKESQDICFLAGQNLNDFLNKKTGEPHKGVIVDNSGKFLGNCKDILSFTVGQRKGIGISSTQPLYVLSIDTNEGKITVGKKENLLSGGLYTDKINLFIEEVPDRAKVRIRSSHYPAGCSVEKTGDGMKVYFDEPQEAVTPGQSAVLYDNDIVLGGGIITGAIN
jgi:tRNA-uridine 2-sulfurtransferase